MLKITKYSTQNPEKIAIISENKSYSYSQLINSAKQFASILLANSNDLNETRVAFMVNPSFDYVQVQWGIWLAGGVAVPLCITYPLPSLQYVIEDTDAEIIVISPEYVQILSEYVLSKGKRLIILDKYPMNNQIYSLSDLNLPSKWSKTPPSGAGGLFRRAMILYTSGTTNLPKGVVTTHSNIESQISTLIKSWKWSENDRILCVLPLHHVHGIINVVSCALWAGATVVFLPNFSAEAVFETFEEQQINVFMAVPTIYFKLIAHIESLNEIEQKTISDMLTKFRLMVSGSAALPVSVMEKWKKISNHTLLERYGMTEIGMGISNPYEGERKAGYIGKPLSGVKVRLVDENNQLVKGRSAGEIQIKGKNVFKEYWNKPEATQKSFTKDGWFKTGDIAVKEKGYFRILGRDSIDIIKSGGYKISALEIEEVLRMHPQIEDCSVVGLQDEEWGEIVAAALILKENIDLKTLNQWIRERMPAYKTPRKYTIVKGFPRNAMGKVVKNELKLVMRDKL